MLLPLRCLHHVFDSGTLRSTKESEQPLMLGNARFALGFGPGFGGRADLGFCDPASFSALARLEAGRFGLAEYS